MATAATYSSKSIFNLQTLEKSWLWWYPRSSPRWNIWLTSFSSTNYYTIQDETFDSASERFQLSLKSEYEDKEAQEGPPKFNRWVQQSNSGAKWRAAECGRLNLNCTDSWTQNGLAIRNAAAVTAMQTALVCRVFLNTRTLGGTSRRLHLLANGLNFNLGKTKSTHHTALVLFFLFWWFWKGCTSESPLLFWLGP